MGGCIGKSAEVLRSLQLSVEVHLKKLHQCSHHSSYLFSQGFSLLDNVICGQKHIYLCVCFLIQSILFEIQMLTQIFFKNYLTGLLSKNKAEAKLSFDLICI